MGDADVVELKGVARPPHAPVRLVMQSPPRPSRIASIGFQQHLSCPHLPASLSTSSPAGLVHGKVDMPTPLNLFTTSRAADRLSKGPMSRRLVPEAAATSGVPRASTHGATAFSSAHSLGSSSARHRDL